MNWYAAHLVMWVKLKEERQSHFPCWENIVLIHARSDAEAFNKAEKKGQIEEGDCDGSFRWGGQPATWVFGGVRKLVRCDEPEERPGDGSEITYSEFVIDSKAALEQFVAGEKVTISIQDRFPAADVGNSPPARKRRRRKLRIAR
jgi:hypothetical protein